MSYQGQDTFGYMPVQTVDEVADYTDMMGQASDQNHSAAKKNSWFDSPTKSLLLLWFLVLGLYTVLGIFFRKYTA